MRNEDEFKRLFIENVADPNFRLICTRKQVPIQLQGFLVFCILTGFVFQAKVELYLGFFEEGTTSKTRIYCVKIYVEYVLSHAVLLGTILSIIA